jgi:hypothetical protein
MMLTERHERFLIFYLPLSSFMMFTYSFDLTSTVLSFVGGACFGEHDLRIGDWVSANNGLKDFLGGARRATDWPLGL